LRMHGLFHAYFYRRHGHYGAAGTGSKHIAFAKNHACDEDPVVATGRIVREKKVYIIFK